MGVTLIAGQSNPQVKNITEKNDILVVFFQNLKHPKKFDMVADGLIYVGIADNDHC